MGNEKIVKILITFFFFFFDKKDSTFIQSKEPMRACTIQENKIKFSLNKLLIKLLINTLRTFVSIAHTIILQMFFFNKVPQIKNILSL